MCSLPPRPKPEGPSGGDWPHPHHIALSPKSPQSPTWSQVVLRDDYNFLCIFLVPAFWEHCSGLLVTWSGGLLFSALGPWEESTSSVWVHSWWGADMMLEGGWSKEDTDKPGAVLTMLSWEIQWHIPGPHPETVLRRPKQSGQWVNSKVGWAIRSWHLASLLACFYLTV